MNWIAKSRWQYWNGGKVVELRRSLIEFRPTETHQHFVVPYQRTDLHSIVAVERDLREWDWIAESSKAVEPVARREILEEMREALAAGGTVLTIRDNRGGCDQNDPLSSVEAVSDYLFFLANLLRDIGEDRGAAEAFYAAIGFLGRNPIPTEFLESALSSLKAIESSHSQRLNQSERARLHTVVIGVASWLRARQYPVK